MARSDNSERQTSEVLNGAYDEDGKFLYTGDFQLAVAQNLIPGMAAVNNFGNNPSSAIDTQEDMWDNGGTYPYPATALITSISQTADQVAMRGAIIEVEGLDANWDLTVQTTTLNASNTTTVVTLGTALIRVFRAKVLADVVGDSPIRVHNAGETVDYAVIQIGHNQTLMAFYTVPNGKTAYVTNYYMSVTRTAANDPVSTEFKLWASDRDNLYAFQLKHAIGLPVSAPPFDYPFRPYAKFTQKTDLKMTSYCEGKAGHVHGGFDIILVDN